MKSIMLRFRGICPGASEATGIAILFLVLSLSTLQAQSGSRDSSARAQRNSDSVASAAGSYVGLVPRFGVRVGMSHATLGEPTFGLETIPGASRTGRTTPVGGTFLDLEMMRSRMVLMGLTLFDMTYALRPELLYQVKGGSNFQSSASLPPGASLDSLYNLTTTRQLDYLEIPLTLRITSHYGKVVGVSAHAGIYGAILLSSTVEHRTDFLQNNELPARSVSERKRLDAIPFDSGIVFGLSLDFSLYATQLALDLRGSSGFAPVVRGDEDSRLRSAMLTLTWMVE